MKRIHLWPYIVLLFTGVYMMLAFEQFFVLVVGFVFCAVGTGHLIFHLTVDEHFQL